MGNICHGDANKVKIAEEPVVIEYEVESEHCQSDDDSEYLKKKSIKKRRGKPGLTADFISIDQKQF